MQYLPTSTPLNHPNVGKYAIQGVSGICRFSHVKIYTKTVQLTDTHKESSIVEGGLLWDSQTRRLHMQLYDMPQIGDLLD